MWKDVKKQKDTYKHYNYIFYACVTIVVVYACAEGGSFYV